MEPKYKPTMNSLGGDWGSTMYLLGGNPTCIGHWGEAHIDDTALYTGNYTVPTTALGTEYSGKQSLLNFENASDIDEDFVARSGAWSDVTSMLHETSTVKFGTGAIKHGTSSTTKMCIQNEPCDAPYMDGDFRWMIWFYEPNTTSNISPLISYSSNTTHRGLNTSVVGATGARNVKLQLAMEGTLSSFDAEITGTTTITAGWHYLEINRIGNVFRVFVDGVQEATTTQSGNISFNGEPFFGLGRFGYGASTHNGTNGYVFDGFVAYKDSNGNTSNYSVPTDPEGPPYVVSINDTVNSSESIILPKISDSTDTVGLASSQTINNRYSSNASDTTALSETTGTIISGDRESEDTAIVAATYSYSGTFNKTANDNILLNSFGTTPGILSLSDGLWHQEVTYEGASPYATEIEINPTRLDGRRSGIYTNKYWVFHEAVLLKKDLTPVDYSNCETFIREYDEDNNFTEQVNSTSSNNLWDADLSIYERWPLGTSFGIRKTSGDFGDVRYIKLFMSIKEGVNIFGQDDGTLTIWADVNLKKEDGTTGNQST